MRDSGKLDSSRGMQPSTRTVNLDLNESENQLLPVLVDNIFPLRHWLFDQDPVPFSLVKWYIVQMQIDPEICIYIVYEEKEEIKGEF